MSKSKTLFSADILFLGCTNKRTRCFVCVLTLRKVDILSVSVRLLAYHEKEDQKLTCKRCSSLILIPRTKDEVKKLTI